MCGAGSDDSAECCPRGIGSIGVDDEVVIELVVPVPVSETPSRDAAQGPHPDRVVHDPGQPHLAGCIADDEPGDDREEAESDERSDEEFHE